MHNPVAMALRSRLVAEVASAWLTAAITTLSAVERTVRPKAKPRRRRTWVDKLDDAGLVPERHPHIVPPADPAD